MTILKCYHKLNMKLLKDKKVIYTLIKMAIVIISLIAGTIPIIYFNSNYNALYNQPEISNAIIDFKDHDIRNQKIDVNLNGEWKFYYNEWIVSDNISNPKEDLIVSLPSKISSYKIDGKNLPNRGYASYSLTIKNLTPGIEIFPVLNSTRISMNVFMNGELVAHSGTPNKEFSCSTMNSGLTIDKRYGVVKDKDIELVVEVGNTIHGGMYQPIWITTTHERRATTTLIYDSFQISLIAIIILLLLNLGLQLTLFKNRKNMYVVLFSLTIGLTAFTTKDAVLFFRNFFPINVFYIVPLLFFIGAHLSLIFFFLWLQKERRFKMATKYNILIISSSLLFFIISMLLEGFSFQTTMIFISFVPYFIYLFKMFYDSNNKYTYLYGIFFFLLMCPIVTQCLEQTGVLCFGLEGIISILFLIIMSFLIVITMFSLISISNQLKNLDRLENEINNVKSLVLKRQVMNHYIFNTLSSIKSLYSQSEFLGSNALDRFSKRLRNEINYSETNLVKLDDELSDCLNYIELEKLKSKKNIELLIDIDDGNIMIPHLSILTLIENSYKYAFVEKNNGQIIISTKQDSTYNYIIIKDDGVGFDTTQINKNSTGIISTRNRLKILLNGDLEVISSIGNGSQFTIKLMR